MPLLPFQHTPLTIPVSAHAASGLPQQATFAALSLDVSSTQEVSLRVGTQVQFLHPDTQQPIPNSAGISARSVALTADNLCAVYYNEADPADTRNGQILYWRRGFDWCYVAEDGTFTALEGGLDNAPEPLLLQGQWVETLLLAMLAPLILHNMQQADGPPFSRFA